MLCREWIKRRESDHVDCAGERNEESRIVPTRVINVGPSDGSQEPRIFDGQVQQKSYVCLSHRWGDKMSAAMTTTENIVNRRHAVWFRILHQTFKDAVIVTRALGYRFLWIDSLCIIQIDRADWARECPRMASIYRGATVTIAAAASESCIDGFLQPRASEISAPSIRVQEAE